MAILVGEEERKTNWGLIIGLAAVFVVLGASTYYLFFSPTPFIETIVPPNIQKVSQISEIRIDAESIRSVTDDRVARLLRQYVPPPTTASFGRSNPFATF